MSRVFELGSIEIEVFRTVRSTTVPYPSKQEFVALLRERNHVDIIEEHIIHGVPFVFRDSDALYRLLIQEIAAGLQVSEDSITMVGSARIGFSLSPDTFGTPFSPNSDIDMVVVSDQLFDSAWFDMLRLGKRYYRLDVRRREWVASHRASYVYWGFVRPDKLPGVVRFSTDWFSTFRGLSRNAEFARYEITGRLYRTWDHARVYQLSGLAKILRLVSSTT